MDKRPFLAFISMLLITACGGGGGQAPIGAVPAPPPPGPAPSPPPAPPTWNISVPAFIAGSQSTFDLAGTLPSGIAPDGVFSVDSSGTQLPAGMTLSALGILAVGSATQGASGVVFRYVEP